MDTQYTVHIPHLYLCAVFIILRHVSKMAVHIRFKQALVI